MTYGSNPEIKITEKLYLQWKNKYCKNKRRKKIKLGLSFDEFLRLPNKLVTTG